MANSSSSPKLQHLGHYIFNRLDRTNSLNTRSNSNSAELKQPLHFHPIRLNSMYFAEFMHLGQLSRTHPSLPTWPNSSISADTFSTDSAELTASTNSAVLMLPTYLGRTHAPTSSAELNAWLILKSTSKSSIIAKSSADSYKLILLIYLG